MVGRREQLPDSGRRIASRRFGTSIRQANRVVWVLAVVLLLFPARPLLATSLDGLILYSSDDFGNPSGFDWDSETLSTGQLWRSGLQPHWYTLGVIAGLPPPVPNSQFLNGEDNQISIPLEPGRYDLTLLVEGGGGGGGDLQRFAINLYMNEDLTLPSLSVLFARRDAPERTMPQRNRGDVTLTFDIEPVRAAAPFEFDDGTNRVWVDAAYFDNSASPKGTDLVGPGSFTPSGSPDWMGFITLVVEPSAGGATPAVGAGVAAPVDPAAFGMIPGAPAVAAPGAPAPPAAAGSVQETGLSAPSSHASSASREDPTPAGPDDDASAVATPDEATPGATPSAAAAATRPSATIGQRGTPTTASRAPAGLETATVRSSAVSRTPAPAATGTPRRATPGTRGPG